MKITTKKYAEGKHEIRIDGKKLFAVIIGARKRYMLEYWGEPFAIGPFRTITAAASHAADLYQSQSKG